MRCRRFAPQSVSLLGEGQEASAATQGFLTSSRSLRSPPPRRSPLRRIARQSCRWQALCGANGADADEFPAHLDARPPRRTTPVPLPLAASQPPASSFGQPGSLQSAYSQHPHPNHYSVPQPSQGNNTTRILLLANFSPELKTRDIQAMFGEWEDDRGGFKIKWSDDESCWIVFNDPVVGESSFRFRSFGCWRAVLDLWYWASTGRVLGERARAGRRRADARPSTERRVRARPLSSRSFRSMLAGILRPASLLVAPSYRRWACPKRRHMRHAGARYPQSTAASGTVATTPPGHARCPIYLGDGSSVGWLASTAYGSAMERAWCRVRPAQRSVAPHRSARLQASSSKGSWL